MKVDIQQRRIALVIGNSDYRASNPVSGSENALAMKDRLEQLGFEVLPPVLNASLDATIRAADDLAGRIADADVVLLFYSGHGTQINNRNFLIPIDGSVSVERAILLDDLIHRLGNAPNAATKLVFVDACRDNLVLPEGFPKGFTEPPPAPVGTLLAFSTSPGQLAESGRPGETSVYTKALVKYLPEPGLELARLFAKVRTDVFDFSDTGQQTFEAGTLPLDFYFRAPVFVQGMTPGWPHKTLLVVLNGEVVLATDQAATADLRLNADRNDLVLLVSTSRTFHNGFTWATPEGWSYQFDLVLPAGARFTFQDREDKPFKAGPHHGSTFRVARATLFVDPQSAEVSLRDLDTDIWKREPPFWARDQELLFESSITGLGLDLEDVLGEVDLGALAPLLRPLLVELLRTGRLFGNKILDPDRTFAVVGGNKALASVVQHCMTAGRSDRIRDLRASIAAAFQRVERPFEIFDDGLNACLRANGQELGIPLEDLRIWTAFDDRSRDQPASETLAIEAPAALEPAKVTPAAAFFAPSPESLRALAQDAIFHPRTGEALVGRTPVQQVVQGVPITADVYVFLSLQPVEDRVRIHARVVADLSDLQNKIGAVIDTIPLPTDNCSHFGVDNIVARIWGKQITVDGDVATLKLNGDIDVWTCVKNPVPCSRIEWVEERVLGATIRVPKLVFFDCNPPIKNRNLSQPFEATLPFTLAVGDARTFALRLGNPSIDLGGALGGVTEGILRIAGVDINAKVKEALDRAIGPVVLTQTLPEFLLLFDPTLTRAELLSNSGALALSVELEATLDLAGLGRLIEWLITRPRAANGS